MINTTPEDKNLFIWTEEVEMTAKQNMNMQELKNNEVEDSEVLTWVLSLEFELGTLLCELANAGCLGRGIEYSKTES
jgi:hypothetical protein